MEIWKKMWVGFFSEHSVGLLSIMWVGYKSHVPVKSIVSYYYCMRVSLVCQIWRIGS